MFTNRRGSPTPDVRKLYANPYGAVMANINAYRTPVLTKRTEADVLEEFRRNITSFKGIYSAKDVKKALVHGWDEGEVIEVETFEFEDGDDGDDGEPPPPPPGHRERDAGKLEGGELDEDAHHDFMSPPPARREDDDGEEGEDAEEAVEDDAQALEAYARFKHQGFSFRDVPVPFEGESEASVKNRLRTFVRTLHDKGIIHQRFKVSRIKSFDFSRNRLVMLRLGGRIKAAEAAPGGAAAPPTVAAAARHEKSPARRALTPEVGGSPADVHSLMY